MIALPVLLQTAAAISTMADPLQPATENVNSTKGPPDSQKLMNFRKTSKQPLTTSPPPQACIIVFGAWDPNFFALKYA